MCVLFLCVHACLLRVYLRFFVFVACLSTFFVFVNVFCVSCFISVKHAGADSILHILQSSFDQIFVTRKENTSISSEIVDFECKFLRFSFRTISMIVSARPLFINTSTNFQTPLKDY